MATRATRRVFWWYLSCFAASIERTTVPLPGIPVFPGGGLLYLSSSVGSPPEDSETHRPPSGDSSSPTAVADDVEAENPARLLSAHKRCSLLLLTVRTATLVVALVILSLYGRLSPLVRELQNSTRVDGD